MYFCKFPSIPCIDLFIFFFCRIAIVCPPEPDDSETFRLMCEKIIARRIRLIILNDDEWLQLPLSKQVEYLFSAIAYILRSKDKIVHITKAIEST